MSREIDAHREYLSDRPRVEAFRRAIAETVRPGDVVVDLGAGTGILGLLACEAGAARVYAVDAGSILGIAREIAAANGWADRIVYVREMSTRARLDETADVIVTDQIGHFGIEAGLVEYMRDAALRWLKPGGRTVPMAVDLWVAPVESAELRGRIDFWNSRPNGFDTSGVLRPALNSGYPAHLDPAWLTGGAARIATLTISPTSAETFRGEAELIIDRLALVDGIGGWFTAALSPSVTMTNTPGHPCRINRRQVFLPIAERTAVEAGDRVRVSMVARPAELLINWTVTIEPAAAGRQPATFRHSTLRGMLLEGGDVRRSRPDFMPRLTPAGEARRSVLELCDGNRSVREIEGEMLARHAALLPDAASAAAFVAEVLAVYAR